MRMEKLKQHADHFRDVSVAAEESLKQVRTCSIFSRLSLCIIAWKATRISNIFLAGSDGK